MNEQFVSKYLLMEKNLNFGVWIAEAHPCLLNASSLYLVGAVGQVTPFPGYQIPDRGTNLGLAPLISF